MGVLGHRTNRLVIFGAVASLVLALTACGANTTAPAPSPSVGQAIGQPSPILSGNLSSVSCGSSTMCAAVGMPFDPSPMTPVLTGSNDAGLHWKTVTSPAPASTNFNDVACSEKSCLAVGFSGVRLVFLASADATSWQTITPSVVGDTPQAIGCAQTRWCVAIMATSSGIMAMTTTDAGKQWSAPSSLPAGVGQVLTVTCSSMSVCITTGIDPNGNPQVLMTTTGLGGWEIATLPAGSTSVLSASCKTQLSCFVVVRSSTTGVSQILEDTPASSTFQVGPMLAGLANPAAVSCAETTCVFAGSDKNGLGAVVSRTGKRAALSITTSYVPTAFLGLSCATPTQCVGVTSSSLVQIDPSVPQSS